MFLTNFNSKYLYLKKLMITGLKLFNIAILLVHTQSKSQHSPNMYLFLFVFFFFILGLN